jgi:hypothetical protein
MGAESRGDRVVAERRRIGEILIEAGVLTQQQLERALSIQKEDGRRLGSILLAYDFVAEPQLIQALSRQLSVPWVSLWHVDVSDEVLELVPYSVARDCCAVPVYVRFDREKGPSLYVAMDDPTNLDVLAALSRAARMPVTAMVAGPSDIAEAIRDFYGVQEPASGVPRPEVPTAKIRIDRTLALAQAPAAPARGEDRASASASPEPAVTDTLEMPAVVPVAASGDEAEDVVTLEEAQVVASDADGADAAIRGEPMAFADESAALADDDAPTPPPVDVDADDASTPTPTDDAAATPPPAPAEPDAGDDSDVDDDAPTPPPALRAEADVPVAPASVVGVPLAAAAPSPPSSDPDVGGAAARVERDRSGEAAEGRQTGKARRAIALTLLDGTTISLAAAERDDAGAAIASVPELVSLLRAAARGERLAKPLPDLTWEAWIANLVELIVRKRVLEEDDVLAALLR